MNPLDVMSRAGWVAVSAVGLAAVITAGSCWPALLSAFQRVQAPASTVDPKQAEERHKQDVQNQIAAVKGRSLFFPAPRPQPPRDPEPVRPPEPPKPPPPPPAPARYGGPAIQALVTGSVWFTDGTKALVGETVGTGSSAVTVLAADSPYGVKLKWSDKEWEVAMLERDGVVYPAEKKAEPAAAPATTPEAKTDGKAEPKPDAKPEDKKPEEPKADPAKPGETKPGETKPADAAPAAPKTEPSKAEEPKKETGAAPAPSDTPGADKKVEGRP